MNSINSANVDISDLRLESLAENRFGIVRPAANAILWARRAPSAGPGLNLMPRINRLLQTIFLAVVVIFNSPVIAAEQAEEADEKSTEGKFLPLPIFITEPAIGEGIGAGLVYFHKKDVIERPKVLTGTTLARTARRSRPPPTATGVFAAYTNNDTAGVGIGHARSMRNDKYRFVGAAAQMRVNAATFISDIPFDFELDGNLAFAGLKRRIGESNVFLGVSISVLDADVAFKLDSGGTLPLSLSDFGFTSVGIAGSAAYDARDDTMMPSSGQLIDLTAWWYDDAIGSDFNYSTARLKVNSFHQLHERFVLGLRFDVSTVRGSPPFFAIPYVSIRGIPALRYQGDTAGVVEIEGRFTLSERWGAIAFAGTGYTESLATQDTDINAFGIGVRFKAIKQHNVWVGLDLAKGPEDYAWYLQVGHPW